MNVITRLRTLRDHLSQFRFNYGCEDDLQCGIAQVLSSSQFEFVREHRISALDRLDFLVDGDIAIETKIGGSAASLMRQVSRYAEHAEIAGILVITDRASHVLPESFNGKPVLIHSLLEGAF